jgi:hypothetical protein
MLNSINSRWQHLLTHNRTSAPCVMLVGNRRTLSLCDCFWHLEPACFLQPVRATRHLPSTAHLPTRQGLPPQTCRTGHTQFMAEAGYYVEVAVVLL